MRSFCSITEEQNQAEFIRVDRLNQIYQVVSYIPGKVNIVRGLSTGLTKVMKPNDELRKSTSNLGLKKCIDTL